MKIIKNGVSDNDKEIKFKCSKCGCVFSETSGKATEYKFPDTLIVGKLYSTSGTYTALCPMEFCNELCWIPKTPKNPMKAVKTVSYGNWNLRK